MPVSSVGYPSFGGVTKTLFFNVIVMERKYITTLFGRFFKLSSYLTGVTAAKLQKHLSNMNVIFKSGPFY